MIRVALQATIYYDKSMKNNQSHKSYHDISIAISYLVEHAQNHPSLEDVSKVTGLSKAHLQKTFKKWVGLSPKQFLKYVSITRAKSILQEENLPIVRASAKTGLSSSGRLHDLFVTVESMTPGQFKSIQTGSGQKISINYSSAQTPYGHVVLASTSKGLAHLTFIDDQSMALPRLKEYLPYAHFTHHQDDFQKNAVKLFFHLHKGVHFKNAPLHLHLKGTPFQIKVWESLLTIPSGLLETYGGIATAIGRPNAYRAVGTAVGKNPLSFIIPCHRIIQSSGVLGNYMWGPERKKIMIAHEAAKNELKNQA